jgi:xylose isomerase
MIEHDALADFKAKRYAGWDASFGQQILAGGYTLESLAQEAVQRDLRPTHQSGRQEQLENLVNAYVYR